MVARAERSSLFRHIVSDEEKRFVTWSPVRRPQEIETFGGNKKTNFCRKNENRDGLSPFRQGAGVGAAILLLLLRTRTV
jgi:hypothetical protein